MSIESQSYSIKNDVLTGLSGYLYLWMGRQKQFAYLCGEQSISEFSERNFRENVVSRAKFFSEREIPYLHVVFPSKPLVKKEYLPKGIRVSSLYKKFLHHESVLYPLDKLLVTERTVSTFRRLDTHMTDDGSLCVVKLLIEKLDSNLFNRAMFRPRHKLVSGDLARMLASDAKSSEQYLEPVHIDGTDFYIRSFNNHSALEGNSGRITVQHCSNSLTDRRLLIFGDSFFHAMLHLLAPYFKDILFVRSAFVYKELVGLFNPDVVYSGNAERYLQSVPNDKDNGFFFLNDLYRNAYNPNSDFLNALDVQLSYGCDFIKYKRWASNLEASLLNQYANTFIQSGQYSKAVSLLTRAVAIKPNNVAIKEKLADCLQLSKTEDGY